MEDVTVEVEGIVEDGAEVTQNGLDLFKRISNSYYNNVWIEPASIISIETVEGLSANKVIKQRKKYLPLAAGKIETSLEELKQKSKELNLSLSENNFEKSYKRSYEYIGEPAVKCLTEMLKIYAK